MTVEGIGHGLMWVIILAFAWGNPRRSQVRIVGLMVWTRHLPNTSQKSYSYSQHTQWQRKCYWATVYDRGTEYWKLDIENRCDHGFKNQVYFKKHFFSLSTLCQLKRTWVISSRIIKKWSNCDLVTGPETIGSTNTSATILDLKCLQIPVTGNSLLAHGPRKASPHSSCALQQRHIKIVWTVCSLNTYTH
jgi:hypothetical protein